MMEAAALLFDMDGVLVDSRATIDRVRRRWARHRGLDEEAVVRLPHGQKTRDIIAAVAPHLDVMEEVRWLDADEEHDLDGIMAIPGAARLLASLAPEAWAVVTSSGRELALKRLGAAGLPLPRTLIAGDMVAQGKPAPDGYLRGARELGARVAACIVVEDALAGIEAGLAAGMRVIGVATTYPRGRLVRATAIVADLSEIAAEHRGGGLIVRLHSSD
jgi:sugar-phosphatase